MISKDNFKVYILGFLLLLLLFFTLFVSNIFSTITLSIVLLLYMFIAMYFLKKKKILSIYNKQVIILMIVLAIIYLILFYLVGIYFGFSKALVKLSLGSFLNYILPYTIIIISSEIIRYIFISQKAKLSRGISFIAMVLLDIIIYSQIYDLTRLDDFLTVIGFVFFSSISCNLLYNYISSRFGYMPIIAYRLITILYCYFIPIIPDIFIFFRAVFRIIYPYLIYLLLEYTYARTSKVVTPRNRKANIISITFLIIFSVLLVLFVSCKFRYGILVIGSGSMTGTIDKGDALVFEKFENQNIKNGDIIIFQKDRIRVVHRIVDKKIVNDEYRYYTKGDANKKIDDGYIIKSDIVGISKFKISRIGYPSIWFRDIFDK